uniref:Uncharacterized protein n=1 Tax=Globodera rostochiensis TaxID=31243 RepID=A0A914HL43_GLORO
MMDQLKQHNLCNKPTNFGAQTNISVRIEREFRWLDDTVKTPMAEAKDQRQMRRPGSSVGSAAHGLGGGRGIVQNWLVWSSGQ